MHSFPLCKYIRVQKLDHIVAINFVRKVSVFQSKLEINE
jgi:hypothetical protein